MIELSEIMQLELNTYLPDAYGQIANTFVTGRKGNTIEVKFIDLKQK